MNNEQLNEAWNEAKNLRDSADKLLRHNGAIMNNEQREQLNKAWYERLTIRQQAKNLRDSADKLFAKRAEHAYSVMNQKIKAEERIMESEVSRLFAKADLGFIEVVIRLLGDNIMVDWDENTYYIKEQKTKDFSKITNEINRLIETFLKSVLTQ